MYGLNSPPTFSKIFPYLIQQIVTPTKPDKNVEELVLLQAPTWGKDAKKEEVKATWLGHACFLVELPTPSIPGATRGARILFDPVFSHRCSPSQWFGPSRYTSKFRISIAPSLTGVQLVPRPSLLTLSYINLKNDLVNNCLLILEPPVSMNELPEVDAVVISHNHYDHMDIPTLTVLREKYNPHFFAPLNNEQTFLDTGIEPSRFHCLDWWDERDITVQLPVTGDGSNSGNEIAKIDVKFKLTCTPCQHISARTPFDRCHTLWSSWALEELPSPQHQGFKLWFGGDTGYRHIPQGTSVSDEDDETKIPYCPAFKEIGEKFGGFDLALIPIGAYEPRNIMSAVHASPSDAVRIFKDVKAKKALGMHWG
jgi:N-acyl-phosphatidylethanolamine-hydrolysing phospholipase D